MLRGHLFIRHVYTSSGTNIHHRHPISIGQLVFIKSPQKTQSAPCYRIGRATMAGRVSETSNPRAEGEGETSSGIRVHGMQFSYDAQPPLFCDFNLNIAPGSRCLLVGANGSGNWKPDFVSPVWHFLRSLWLHGNSVSWKAVKFVFRS